MDDAPTPKPVAGRRTKFPRTVHFEHSGSRSADDLVAPWAFDGPVVATVKLDGEATTVYPDGTCHARSLDSGPHPSRTWVRAFAAAVGPQLPARWRLCGENVFAVHAITYDDLDSYFYGINLWDAADRCLDWDATLEWFDLLGVVPVPEFYRGAADPPAIHAAWTSRFGPDDCEGYVVRPTGGFDYADYGAVVRKYVRPRHVQAGDEHWLHRELRVNALRAGT
jgi:hypothetical protein